MNELFEILRWLAGGGALALGGLISLGNWVTLIGIIVTKGRSSFVPFIGGVLAAIGMLILPVADFWRWAWIPLFADFGTLPMWIWALVANRFDKTIPPKTTTTEQAGSSNGG
jgi:hypothetical protein